MTTEATQTQDEQTPPRDDDATVEAGAPREAGATVEAPAAAPPAREFAGPGDALQLQPRLLPRADGLYYVSELLAYHDEAFVEAAFASVLRRQPSDEEFRNTLADLRNGAREKIDILRDLGRSKEGKSQSAFERIAGLRQSRLAELARSLPGVGHLWQILAAVARLPLALRHQRQFEAYALAQQQRIADHVNSRRLGDLVVSQLQLAINDVSASVSMLSDAMAEMGARHAERHSQLAHRFNRAAGQLEAAERRLDEATRRMEEAERRLAAHDARLDDHAGWFAEYSRGLEDHGRQLTEQARRLDAQQEFLVREQQSIVEAQKAAVASAEEDLNAAVSAQRRELVALAARVEELRAAIEAARESVGGKV
jgi:hypothetical protein